MAYGGGKLPKSVVSETRKGKERGQVTLLRANNLGERERESGKEREGEKKREEGGVDPIHV